MKQRDARKLSGEALEELRMRAVSYEEKGYSQAKIGELLDVHRCTVNGWLKKARRGGVEALKSRKRGPRFGTRSQLTSQQQKSITKLITDKTPDQLKLSFALWTREAVGDLIALRTGKRLDVRQVGRYLRKWGFTPQRPAKRAYQRCEKKVAEWIKSEYPQIEKQARKEGAEIYWADEAGLYSHDHRGRGYSPKGKTPVRLHNPNKEKINMISALTNQGKLRFLCYEGSFDYRMFHRFLKGLIIEAKGRKIHVIVDNLRVHHSKKIKRWVRRYQQLIALHYLPSYSPDLNPDEYFNGDIKAQLAKRPERRKKGHWAKTVQTTAEHIASQSSRVASYFRAAPIRYASSVV